jgi:hypothetical protein
VLDDSVRRLLGELLERMDRLLGTMWRWCPLAGAAAYLGWCGRSYGVPSDIRRGYLQQPDVHDIPNAFAHCGTFI